MCRSELLEAASKRLGVQVPADVLRVAIRGGFVQPDPERRLGWVSYPPEAVDRLVAYCKFHSRTIARQSRDRKGGGK